MRAKYLQTSPCQNVCFYQNNPALRLILGVLYLQVLRTLKCPWYRDQITGINIEHLIQYCVGGFKFTQVFPTTGVGPDHLLNSKLF